MPDSLGPHGLYPTRLLCPWNSSGKNKVKMKYIIPAFVAWQITLGPISSWWSHVGPKQRGRGSLCWVADEEAWDCLLKSWALAAGASPLRTHFFFFSFFLKLWKYNNTFTGDLETQNKVTYSSTMYYNYFVST